MFRVPEQFRITSGPFASSPADGNNGCFDLEFRNVRLAVIASDGLGWEHVSVSLKNRCPNWPEMCYVKSLFWEEEDCVVQYHPPKSEYVNVAQTCLHLWRPNDGHELKRPPKIMVG